MEHKYRYPGTQPFQEEDWYLFYGRDREKSDLVELIGLEQVVVLFGKSGYGKSSLLNAAVIPFLRRFERYAVHSIRLVEPMRENARKRSPLEVLEARLLAASEESEFPFPGFDIPSSLPEDPIARLWYYLKKIELANPDSNTLTLIFDQFEELRQFNEDQIRELGEALNALLYLQTPPSVRRLITEKLEEDPNSLSKSGRRALLGKLDLKLVFSLHHDRLNLLDKLKEFIPDIFKFTYELKPLRDAQALEALKKPAALDRAFQSPVFSYSKAACDFILSHLKDSEDGLIEPFQLQLLAQHAEQKMIARNKKTGNRFQTSTDHSKDYFVVEEKDLSDPKKIYRKHYQKAILTLPFLKRAKARNLIQKGLIIDGNRIPLPEALIHKHYKVSRNSLEKLQETRLLRSELNTTRGTSWELSHDSLIEPIQDSAERRKRRLLWMLVIGIFLAIIGALVYWALMERERANTAESALTNGIIINPLVIAKVQPVPTPLSTETQFTYQIMKPPGDVIVKSVRWRFGDGDSSAIRMIGASTSRFDTITHRYQSVGTYKAELVVVDDAGEVRVDPVTIEVIEDDTPGVRTIGIHAIPAGGRAPLSIQFSLQDTLLGNETAYQWTVNDSTFSSAPTAEITFKNPGRYRVALNLPEIQGLVVEPKEIVIDSFQVPDPVPPDPIPSDYPEPSDDPEPPVAVARADTTEGIVPFTVDFRGNASTSENLPLTYHWELDADVQSNEPNPTHTYQQPGTYRVILTVQDPLDNIGRDTVQIAVKPDSPPIALALARFNNGAQQAFRRNAPETIAGKAPFAVSFDAGTSQDDLGLISYEWDFGDGITASGMRANHTFINGRVHTVELTVRDAKGQTASAFLQVDVSYPLVSPEVNYQKWLQRFVYIQNTKLVGNQMKADLWEELIPPDSLNLVGIYLDDPAISSTRTLPDLLFFFTPSGNGKLYKFRSQLNTENLDTPKTERFSLKSLIQTAERNAKRNTGNESPMRTRKFLFPNDSVADFSADNYANLAEMFKANKTNNKTINVYYTVFPYSYLSDTSQAEVRNYYQLLGEPRR